jgi:hypothetical protein
MAMKETAKSLMTYFSVSAGFAALGAWDALKEANRDVYSIAAGVILIAFAGAYVYAGSKVVKLQTESPQPIIRLLYLALGLVVLSSLASLAGGDNMRGGVTLVIGVLLTWYLVTNVKRLSREARSSTSAQGES